MLQWKTLNFDAVNGFWSFDCFYHLLTTFHVFRVSFVDEMVVRVILDTKGGSCSQAFLAETGETGNKSRRVTEATHVLRRKLRKDDR